MARGIHQPGAMTKRNAEREEAVGEELVDNRGLVTRKAVEIAERPAPEKAEAKGGEIPRVDRHQIDSGQLLISAGGGFALDRQVLQAGIGEWRCARDSGGPGIACRVQPVLDLLIES